MLDSIGSRITKARLFRNLNQKELDSLTEVQKKEGLYHRYYPSIFLYINLAPFGKGEYTLTVAPGEMLKIQGENKQAAATNGWFKPAVPLPEFLARFSQVGATHHSVLVYGDVLETLLPLADYLGCKLEVIK